MILLKLLMFTLTFYELLHLDASKTICPKGKRVVKGGCEICHNGTYQATENDSTRCKVCKKCDEQSGSITVTHCTNKRNAECQCRSGFVPSDSDYSTCKCDTGFGLSIHNGHKALSFNLHSRCKSVGTPGTTTLDVICNDTSATTQPTPTKTFFKRLTSQRPQEGAENQKVHSTATTTTKSSSASDTHPATTKVRHPYPRHPYPPSTGNYIGMALLIFGIVGLLVLTAVTCKLQISPYLEKNTAETSTCSLIGLAELFPGNKTHNSICDRGENPGNMNMFLGVGFVFLSFTMLVISSHVCIKNLMKNKAYARPIDIVVPTKPNDFHLSKEESGFSLQGIIFQDESKNSEGLECVSVKDI
ncbi:hypothetical protein GBF38_013388 [Nibea albiflora]|uniref:Uncharacterized protein n=1 Tax=Nibea albiflora TaxID=240163 RepID=A0ACB7EZT5_NIBAL|nr:hypothetical protein GBF38_013388 [Nibea albiflora]